jgi:uncharacterized protein (DUF2062 family)
VADPRQLPYRVRVRRWLRRSWRALLEERSSPARIGVAVFWGVVVGCSPFYGFQNLIAVGSATLFRLNRPAVVLAAQVTMPPFTPLVIFASLQVGHLLRFGQWLAISLDEVRAAEPEELAKRLAADFVLGSFTVGVALGIPIALLAMRAVVRSRRARDPTRELEHGERAALDDRLDFLPGTYRHYGAWKVKLDPVYPLALSALADRRDVVDLGGGMGLLAALFSARHPEARVRVVEWDTKKVAAARALLEDLPRATVVEGDAREHDVAGADGAALLDVLHYVPADEQRAWLERIARRVAPEATIVIRELDPSAKKGRLASIIDAWMVRLGWNRGGGVHAWPIEEIRALLEAEGFRVEVAPAGRGAFRANAIVVARRS